MKIIYPLTDGGIAVIHPAEGAVVAVVAEKDVPFGVPYLIVADDAIPEDRSQRAGWDADFSKPDGHGLGSRRWFIKRAEEENALLLAAERPAMTGSLDDYVVAVADFEFARAEAIAANNVVIEQMKNELKKYEGVTV